MNFAGLGFVFGAKDEGASKVAEKTEKSMAALNSTFENLEETAAQSRFNDVISSWSLSRLDEISDKVANIAGEMGSLQMTTGIEQEMFELEKAFKPVAASMGMTAEQSRQARKEIYATVTALNVSADVGIETAKEFNKVGKSMLNAFSTGKDAFKDTVRIMKAFDWQASETKSILESFIDAQGRVGVSADKAKSKFRGFADFYAAYGQATGDAMVMMKAFPQIINTVSASAGVLSKQFGLTNEQQNNIVLGMPKLITRLKMMGDETPIDTAKSLVDVMIKSRDEMQALVTEGGNLEILNKILPGIGNNFDEALKTFVQTPDKFVEFVHEIRKSGGAMSTDLFKRFRDTLGEKVVRLMDQPPEAWAKATKKINEGTQKATKNIAGAMSKLAKDMHSSSRTFEDIMGRMEDSYEMQMRQLSGLKKSKILDIHRKRYNRILDITETLTTGDGPLSKMTKFFLQWKQAGVHTALGPIGGELAEMTEAALPAITAAGSLGLQFSDIGKYAKVPLAPLSALNKMFFGMPKILLAVLGPIGLATTGIGILAKKLQKSTVDVYSWHEKLANELFNISKRYLSFVPWIEGHLKDMKPWKRISVVLSIGLTKAWEWAVEHYEFGKQTINNMFDFFTEKIEKAPWGRVSVRIAEFLTKSMIDVVDAVGLFFAELFSGNLIKSIQKQEVPVASAIGRFFVAIGKAVKTSVTAVWGRFIDYWKDSTKSNADKIIETGKVVGGYLALGMVLSTKMRQVGFTLATSFLNSFRVGFLGKVFKILGPIGLAIGSLALIRKGFEKLSINSIETFTDAIKNRLPTALLEVAKKIMPESTANIIDEIAKGAEDKTPWERLGRVFLYFMKEAFTKSVRLTQFGLGFVEDFIKSIDPKAFREKVSNFSLTGFIDGLKKSKNPIIVSMRDIFGSVWNIALKGIAFLKPIFRKFSELDFKKIFGQIGDKIRKVDLGKTWSDIKKIGGDFFRGIANAIRAFPWFDIVRSVVGFIGSVFTSLIVGLISGGEKSVADSEEPLKAGFNDVFKSLGHSVKEIVKGFIVGIGDIFVNIWHDESSSWFEKLTATFITGAIGIFAIKKVINRVKGFFKQPIPTFCLDPSCLETGLINIKGKIGDMNIAFEKSEEKHKGFLARTRDRFSRVGEWVKKIRYKTPDLISTADMANQLNNVERQSDGFIARMRQKFRERIVKIKSIINAAETSQQFNVVEKRSDSFFNKFKAKAGSVFSRFKVKAGASLTKVGFAFKKASQVSINALNRMKVGAQKALLSVKSAGVGMANAVKTHAGKIASGAAMAFGAFTMIAETVPMEKIKAFREEAQRTGGILGWVKDKAGGLMESYKNLDEVTRILVSTGGMIATTMAPTIIMAIPKIVKSIKGIGLAFAGATAGIIAGVALIAYGIKKFIDELHDARLTMIKIRAGWAKDKKERQESFKAVKEEVKAISKVTDVGELIERTRRLQKAKLVKEGGILEYGRVEGEKGEKIDTALFRRVAKARFEFFKKQGKIAAGMEFNDFLKMVAQRKDTVKNVFDMFGDSANTIKGYIKSGGDATKIMASLGSAISKTSDKTVKAGEQAAGTANLYSQSEKFLKEKGKETKEVRRKKGIAELAKTFRADEFRGKTFEELVGLPRIKGLQIDFELKYNDLVTTFIGSVTGAVKRGEITVEKGRQLLSKIAPRIKLWRKHSGELAAKVGANIDNVIRADVERQKEKWQERIRAQKQAVLNAVSAKQVKKEERKLARLEQEARKEEEKIDKKTNALRKKMGMETKKKKRRGVGGGGARSESERKKQEYKIAEERHKELMRQVKGETAAGRAQKKQSEYEFLRERMELGLGPELTRKRYDDLMKAGGRLDEGITERWKAEDILKRQQGIEEFNRMVSGIKAGPEMGPLPKGVKSIGDILGEKQVATANIGERAEKDRQIKEGMIVKQQEATNATLVLASKVSQLTDKVEKLVQQGPPKVVVTGNARTMGLEVKKVLGRLSDASGDHRIGAG